MSKRRNNIFETVKISKILGLDIGEKYIGTAIGDKNYGLVNPHSIIKWDRDIQIFKEEINKIFDSYSIEKVIVGKNTGYENKKVLYYIDEISKVLIDDFSKNIEYVDEHVSTQEAENRLSMVSDLIDIKRTRKDDICAQIILERYFQK